MPAAIDIGTNSIRLLVADLSGARPRRLATGLRVTRLGSGLDATGRIAADRAAATAEAVAAFAGRAREQGAEPILFGTAALREAVNGREVADQIGKAAGGVVRILSGDEEAAATWRGVEQGVRLGVEALVVDIGGGSTEFATRADGGGIHSRSMALGSVRQAERFLHADPPGDEEWRAMLSEIDARVREGLAGRRARMLVGVAGTVTQLAALELGLADYDPDRVEGVVLSAATVETWSLKLKAMTLAERKALVGMVPERADTVIAGTAILSAAIRISGAPGVVVSEYDSLWGMLPE